MLVETIMGRFSFRVAVLSMLSLCLLRSSVAVGSTPKIVCKDGEREALLKFKDNLHDYDGVLSSWGKEEEKRECCQWAGIRCDNKSGHVISLDLSTSWTLRGKIFNSSLIELHYLSYLVLSWIDFSGNQIPSFLGEMTSLEHLDLGYTKLEGPVPETFGNMTALVHLDLSFNKLEGEIRKSPIWSICTLRTLSLSGNNFSGVQVLSELSDHKSFFKCTNYSIEILGLSGNSITGFFPNPTLFSSLKDLRLSSNQINGIVPESVGQLSNLEFLDLSGNSITGFFPNPTLFSSLKELRLSSNQINGSVPESVGQLSNLEFLDLSWNSITGFFPNGSVPESVGQLSNLEFLDLSWNSITVFPNPTLFSSLKELRLSSNQINGSVPESVGQLSNLEILDLSNNSITGFFPNPTLFSSLRKLYLSSNQINGSVPESVGQLSNLEILDLNENSITGWVFANPTLFSLKELWLASNQINGSVPKSVGQLSNLEILDLSSNSFEGVVSETHFLKLSKLKILDLSLNRQLILNVSSDWVPPFQLSYISLSSCTLGPRFPKWLRTQEYFSMLDISNTRISESIPSWFWNPSIGFQTANLSGNQISGTIPNSSIQWEAYPEIDLSSNQLQGQIPLFLFLVPALYLSGNKFSGLNCLCDVRDDSSLWILDVSGNQLSGTIPNCWSNFKVLRVLNLANNKLSGKIPTSIGSVTELTLLHLGNNNFNGELPITLADCSELVVIDVGHNKLFGPIPSWIGESLTKLAVVVLRSNQLYGSIPSNLCHLQHLQLLDLSTNHISGNIPICVGNFTEMRTTSSVDTTISYSFAAVYGEEGYIFTNGDDEETIVWKGTMSEFGTTLGLVKFVDLSCNELDGEIPREITQLVGLVSLNLSTNNMSGQIPLEMGNLKSLDALDLSDNHFSGHIPSSLGLIDRLGVLNLSNNNLSGKIPTNTQLQSRNASSYMGNPRLCGAPLDNKFCPGEEPFVSKPTNHEAGSEDDDEFISQGFYASMGAGFVVGFWGFVGPLLFNKTWRLAYLKWLNGLVDWIYVIVAVHKQKFLTALRS